MERFVSISVKCPHCGESLMNADKPLNGKPSIELKIQSRGVSGTLLLCANYGCYDKQSNIFVGKDEVVDFFCPYCDKDLSTDIKCEECGAPMVTMNLKSGGRVSICSRKGCTKHFVAFDDLSDAIRKFHAEFGEAF
jgi:ssDNA-binding Zn-finger/Zn-ribbon topoisomerase 1